MPTGYPKSGTLFYWAGAPVASVLKVTYPKQTGPGKVDTTALSNTKETNIPNKLTGWSPGTVTCKTSPASIAAIQAIINANTIDDVEIRLTDGESIFVAAAWLSDIDLGGADGAADTTPEQFTFNYNITSADGTTDPVSVSATTGVWSDNCIGLSIRGGDFGLVVGGSPVQLVVDAVYPGGFTQVAPVASLTFASSVVGNATVGANTGIVTWVSNGGATTIRVHITAVPTIDISCVCTTA
jgi:hypothetical protein